MSFINHNIYDQIESLWLSSPFVFVFKLYNNINKKNIDLFKSTLCVYSVCRPTSFPMASINFVIRTKIATKRIAYFSKPLQLISLDFIFTYCFLDLKCKILSVEIWSDHIQFVCSVGKITLEISHLEAWLFWMRSICVLSFRKIEKKKKIMSSWELNSKIDFWLTGFTLHIEFFLTIIVIGFDAQREV